MYRMNKISFIERLKNIPIFVSIPEGLKVFKELEDGTYSSFIIPKSIPVECKECVNNKVCNIRPYERTIKNTSKNKCY